MKLITREFYENLLRPLNFHLDRAIFNDHFT
jgi:hypothetical protein